MKIKKWKFYTCPCRLCKKFQPNLGFVDYEYCLIICVGKWECKSNLVEQKTCVQSFIIDFRDLLYSAVGNSSLSHTPRSKIRTTAEIPLKKGQ